MIHTYNLGTGLQWPSLWRAYALRSSRRHRRPDRRTRPDTSSHHFIMHGWISPFILFTLLFNVFFQFFLFVFPQRLREPYASASMFVRPKLHFDGNHVGQIVQTYPCHTTHVYLV